MKKIIAILISILLIGSLMLASCAPTISEMKPGQIEGEFQGGGEKGTDGETDEGSIDGEGDSEAENNAEISLNMTGKEAAELLLSHIRLDENKISGGLNFMSATDSEMAITDVPQYSFLLANVGSRDVVYLTEEETDVLKEWLDNDGFDMDGSMWMWSDFKGYSNDISFYQSYITSITSQAQSFAQMIRMIKTRINITDKWIDMGGNIKMLLTVSESSEVIYEVHGDNISICNHFVDDSGRDVYEMFHKIYHDNGDVGEIYMRYIDGEYYEFCYDYTPADGDNAKYFRPRVIVDNSRGYWNMFCMTDGASPEEEGGRYFNIGNLVATDEVVYQFQTTLGREYTWENCEFTYSIISPDMKTDILSFNLNNGMVELTLNGFTGVERVQIDSANAQYSYVEEIFGFGDERPSYLANGQALEIVLSNGKVIKYGDTFADGNLIANSAAVHADLGIPAYFSDLTLRFADPANMSVDQVVRAVAQMLLECGLEPACSLEVVEKSMSDAINFSNNFGKFYSWNGELLNSTEEIIKATDVLLGRFVGFETMVENCKNLPVVSLDRYLEPLPETLDFAEFSGYSYGKITIDNGVITAEEMIATLPDHVLLDDGSEYVLRLGLRKYLDDGTPSETVVILHGNNEVYVRHDGENAMAFTQGSEYVIPANLSEGKYLLVAFIATVDEGIRVSKTVPLASVDFESGVVESEVAEITYEKVEDDMLVVTSKSKLYTEIILDAESSYTLDAIIEQMVVEAMARGELVDSTAFEAYNPESGQATALGDGFVLVAGTYRLKYKSASNDGADAYVYCTVTEEMISAPVIEGGENNPEGETRPEGENNLEGENRTGDESNPNGEQNPEGEGKVEG